MTQQIIPWGQINRGQSYGILATDLSRAIRLARLSPNQNILLGEYIEACWGEAIRLQGKRDGQWPDALGCRINLAELARQLGIVRQSLSEAKRDLIASKMIFEDEEDVIRINKRADQWVHHASGKPRLTPEFLAHCRAVQPLPPAAAQARFESVRERPNPRARHQTTVASGPIEYDASRHKPVAPGATNPSPPAPPTLRLSRRQRCTPRPRL